MKALQLTAIDQLDLVDIPVPEPAPDQVLIRAMASTICTSDIQDIHENSFGMALPVILGHESAGVVAAVGADVRGIAVGDHVAAHPVHPCGRCAACGRGMAHLCMDMEHLGLNMQGTFAPFFVARADRVHLLPADMEWATGALMEPVCVCLEALHQMDAGVGDKLLIIGDGPFGIMMARLAPTFGVHDVVVAGREDFRLAFAPRATTVNTATTPHPREHLRELAGEAGFDAVIVAVAAADAVDDAIALARPMGRVVLFAPLPGKTSVDLFTVLVKELELVGSVNDQDRMEQAVAALADPALALGELVTHRFPIDEYRAAFELAEHGRDRAMKIAITFPNEGTTA